jgi:hypothetical protein
MANPAVRWEDQVDVEPARTLRVAGERERRIAAFRAKVRAAGERWAGARPAGLAELLSAAADGDPELARLARAGAELLEDFVEGLSRNVTAVPGDLAADLVDGTRLPRDVVDRLASAYTVVVARPVAERRGGDPHLTGRGVLWTRRPGVLVLLVPDGDKALLDRITRELVDAEGWVATARGVVTELADAYAEASEVLRLVVAGCRPCGVYGMADVLVEHAMIRNDSVAARLAEVIRPLRENPMLWETLVALVRADFNRNQAARDLFVHRSTMSYRLQRIAEITGCDPSRGRGGQLLSAALIADAVV